MVRLRCADRLGASAYPVCRGGRKHRTEGCRAVCRGGSGWGNGFQPGRTRGVGTAAESFFKGDAARYVRGSPRRDASGDFPKTTVPA